MKLQFPEEKPLSKYNYRVQGVQKMVVIRMLNG